ncbi:hypothetical protein FGB62_91g121 [Gracilaria domingensis]|nr:hypothetical protein FGB62_91g121 [Gracilaria domingensis]
MSFSSLASAKARTELQDSITDLKQFEKVLTDCFADGTRAAAETASIFLCGQATTQASAQHISNALKTLPSSVSVENAPPLVYVCAFLAAGFGNESCRAPLQAFSFARTEVKVAALKVITELMVQRLASEQQDCSSLLQRLGGVVLESTGDVYEMDLYHVAKDVTALAEYVTEEDETELLEFALSLCDGRSPYIHLYGGRSLSPQFQGLYINEVVNIASDVSSMDRILSRCLISGMEIGNTTAFQVLWNSHREWVLEAFEISGFDLPLLILSILMGQDAWRGNFGACAKVMATVMQIINRIGTTVRVPRLVSLFISSLCQAIGSIGMAAGAEPLAKNAASVIQMVRGMGSDDKSLGQELARRTSKALNEAAKREWPASAFVLGVIRKLLIIWRSPKAVEDWLKGDCEILVKENTGLFDSSETEAGVLSSLAQDSAPKEISQDSQESRYASDIPAFSVLGMLLALMRHENSRVRYGCLKLLRKVRKESLFLFFFPSIMMLLQEETNGLIVASYLREIMTSPALMSRVETCNVVFSTLIRLCQSHINSEAYGVVLVAFAWASEYAPSIGIRLLVRELERLKNSFDLTRAQARTAAAAAIHKLAEVRPSRCTDLIPFISLCISPKSMEVAPRASSLCFDVMYLMAKEEVLEPIKAVRVVLKNFPSMEVVNPEAMRSYLRLLSVSAEGEGNKKRRKVMQTATEMLRKCITDLSPAESNGAYERALTLSWEAVEQAALSLAQFTVDEILRSAFVDEEPLINLDEEKRRLDRIEECSAQFVRGALLTAERARLNRSNASVALEKLIEKTISHEWKTRKKSSFDPERIGKLRATSEALRRARKAQGLIEQDDLARGDQARATYIRATTSFPVGVLRSAFHLCVDENESTEENQTSLYRPNCTAMRVITNTKILSPALPWASMVEETVSSPGTDPFVKATCFAILRNIHDNNFEVKDKQSKWFGSQCPLFNSNCSTTVGESKQMFLGMAELFPNELERLLRETGKNLPDSMIEAFIRSCAEISPEGRGLQIAAEGLFKSLYEVERHFDDQSRKELERCIVQIGLKRCKSSAALEVVTNADSGNPSVIRVACLYGSYRTVSFAMHGLLSRVSSTGDKELAGAVGRSIRLLPFSQRRDILLMMFENIQTSSGMKRNEMVEISVDIAAHALMVGGLAPGGRALLFASLCSKSRDEQQMIRRLLSFISSVTEA